MRPNKSKPLDRAAFLCYGYITAFALVLMAFEYGEPVHSSQKIQEWDERAFVHEMVEHQPVKPKPEGKRKKKKKKRPDPSAHPEVKKKKRESRTKKIEKGDLKVSSMNKKARDKTKWSVPEYVPQKPVEKHKLSRYATLPGCVEHSDPEKRRRCSSERLVTLLQDKTSYPDMLQEQGVEGKVIVQFVIDKEGRVEKVRVKKSDHPLFGKEVKEAVKELPNFSPAKMEGKKVKMWQTAPVRFNIR
ncbi:MAG: TonB family protein [Flavobacteriales bacterium]